ncbi:MAG: metal-dependent transcriptional regulator [Gemmatimonadota bacterium]
MKNVPKRARAGGTRAGTAPERAPSRAAEDYLKAVYKLQAGGDSVSTSALAEELGRSAASVTNMVKALADQGLLEHVPYRGVLLTSEGEQAALRIIRRHRVIEAYLIEKLEYTWDGVHAEAERLEHAASEILIDRMDRALGRPAIDPHGAPIPTRDGEIARREFDSLADLPVGTPAVVREVSDEDSQRLRYLASLGLFPGTVVVLREKRPFGGPLTLSVEGTERVVDRRLATMIRVERV